MLEKTEKKNRVEWIDITRGLAILCMIYAHSYIGTMRCSLIFTFHMPVFFILSGYLYRTKSRYNEVVKHSAQKVLAPYIFTNAFLIIGRVVRYKFQPEVYGYCGRLNVVKESFVGALVGFGCGANESYTHFPFREVWSVGALWFFLAFFWAGVLFDGAMRLSHHWNKMNRGILMLIISMAGIAISYNAFWLPTNLDVGLFCVMFLYAGYLMRCYNVEEYNSWLLVVMAIIVGVVAYSRQSISLNIRSVPSVLTIFAALFGTILLIEISKAIEKYFPKKIKRGIAWFGKNGMVILCVHLLELELLPYDVVARVVHMERHFGLLMTLLNLVLVVLITVPIQAFLDSYKKRRVSV